MHKRIKKGFTLVELLVVIAIIGMLAALITAAATGAFRPAKNTQIKVEMSSIEMAIDRYKAEYGEYPPDFFDDTALVRHVRKRWPRYQLPSGTVAAQAAAIRIAISNVYRGRNVTNADLRGSDGNLSSLVVWLGGFPNSDGLFQGFNANPEAPFGMDTTVDSTGKTPNQGAAIGNTVTLSTLEKKAFIDLTIGDNVAIATYTNTSGGGPATRRFPCLISKGSKLPLVYFRGSSGGGAGAYSSKSYDFKDVTADVGEDWSELGLAVPYARTSAPTWFNPTSFQLIHPGQDAKFGSGTGRSIDGTGLTVDDYDNITNFGEPTVESIMP